MGLYDIIRAKAPGWIADPARRHWGTWFDALALTVDALSELADIGFEAALPGQVEGVGGVVNLGGFSSVDALPYIGEDCLVPRGLAESPGHYAQRLRRYRDDWRRAGTAFGLLDQVAGVLSSPGQPNPLLRIFGHLTGRWYTRHPDGTIRYQTAAGDGFWLAPDGSSGPDTTHAVICDWDSGAAPRPFGWDDRTRFFLVIYCPTNLPYLRAISGTIGDGRRIGMRAGTSDAATIGTTSPHKHVELTRGVVMSRRCAGYRCSHIIEAFDPTSFNPDGSSAFYPDGGWGWPARVNALGVMAPARDLTARYWRGEPGGVAGT